MKLNSQKILICFIAFICLVMAFVLKNNSIPKESGIIIGAFKDRFSVTDTTENYAVNLAGSRRFYFPLIKDLEEPQWSPDGKWIIYSTRYSEAHAGGNSEIYLMSYDGKTKIQVTNNKNENDYAPSWSPDGKKIVYYSSVNGQWGIFLLNITCFLEDQDCKVQPEFVVKGEYAKWSPTSSELLVESTDQVQDRILFIYNLENKEKYELNIRGWGASWSPDGKKIAYYDSKQEGVVIIAKDGGSPYMPIPNDKTAIYPTWSPDGKCIFFISAQGHYGKPFKFLWGAQEVQTRGVFSFEISTGKTSQLSLYTNEGVIWYAWYPGESTNLVK